MPYTPTLTKVIHDPGPGAFWPGAEFTVSELLCMLKFNHFNEGTIIEIPYDVGDSSMQWHGFSAAGHYEIIQRHMANGTPRQKARRV